jgi:2-polyprenyl-3-methyl-5-hydroxy-6-metoxy-1,4-benzoquinol methylase
MEEISCDLCGLRESIPLYHLTDTLYNLPGTFVLRRCLRCDLMYLSPRPTRETIADYYPVDYSSYRPPIDDEPYALMRWIRRRKLVRRRQLIEKYSARRGARLLDVGCATGLFLHEMSRSGWHVAGVEPIGSAADYASRRFALEVYQGTLGTAPYGATTFDVVTFWDVLEHTFSPAGELAKAAFLLKPGGLIAISVPNWESIERWLFGRHWQGLDPPRHLYVFNRRTLTMLLNQAGFRILDWVCFLPGYFSFIISLERWLSTKDPRLARMANTIFNIPGMRFPFEPWFTFTNHLKKGAVISVFAVKEAA